MASGGRVDKMKKNIAWGTFSRIIVMIYSFVSRTIFIQVMGATCQGINGLFSNILTMLSFAELGIGTAMNFSLYKLVADQDIPKIKSYMHFYKKAYRVIAAVVAGVGICIMPLLPYILKNSDTSSINGNIYVIYGLFLFNTVCSYFVSYKYSLSNAEQKNYIFTNINLIFNLVCQTGQLVILALTNDFVVYCSVGAVVQLLQNLVTNWYMNKLYPYLKEKDAEKLSKEDLGEIIKNVKALVISRIGGLLVTATDNIIITTVLGAASVGFVDNYNTLLKNVNGFVKIVMDAQTASFGNLIATESKEKVYRLFKNFRFLTFWMYGFISVACFSLMTPFVVVWLGTNMTVTAATVALILINNYIAGHNSCVYNVKVAGGLFQQDQFLAFATAAVNLIASIGLSKLIGLPGIFIGTLLTYLLEDAVRPHIIYKHIFHEDTIKYYINSAKYLLLVLISGGICYGVQHFLFADSVYAHVVGKEFNQRLRSAGLDFLWRFGLMAVIAVLVPNLLFFLVYRKTEEFQYLKGIFAKVWNKLAGKFRKKKATI